MIRLDKGCAQGRAMRATLREMDQNIHRLARLANRYENTLKFREAIAKEKALIARAKELERDHVARCEQCV